MTGNWNPRITTGGGFDRTLTFTEDGAIYALTSATAVMTMTPPSGTVTSPTLTVNGAAGTVRVQLTAAQVAAIDWDQGVVQSVLTITQSGTYAEAIELAGIATLV